MTQPPHPDPAAGGAAGLRAATGALLDLDRVQGAGAAAAPAAAAVARARAGWRAAHRHRAPDAAALSALAELLEVAGWILFDAERHDRALRLNRQALALARHAGDRSLARLVVANLTMQQAHLGDSAASYRTATAVTDAGGLTPRVEAVFRIRQAHALADAGHRAEALRALARARSLFLDGPSDRDPPWAWWIDEDELTGHHGMVLARLGDLDRASGLLHAATGSGQGPAYRSLFTAELLDVLVRSGAHDEAAALMGALAPHLAGIGSVRALNSLRRTAGAAALARGPAGDVRDAARDLARLLGAGPPSRRL
ncbi:hypothetical protein GCM10010218_45150 [Streptomyces mashuensis]|uniref:Transcriptional regulator n=1 Tax=Streptomyces mashuensis TaxID=33904 RepID=A0A919B5Q3_9ACTN|nr:DNA-binding protein [Streptomyces mashuensis]GHF58786.1 hypothetical protein GCM10010218_45150 [Streptomyces mashuensis]